ncbi:LacI family DNA-binding transcriptional regulator [Paenibacillus sp. LHD-117]|uniref:LacI family DNA-binding transcriptional regulator n=1 Tax=Paenibacillus sp. LHD-117 TaxID=3071412 RepID=UPI0027E10013|nr:LacI family DNA-binding transcriptional regulator [Paenibacillus sp. LHD-117]MDQ6421549.1 LacI family DNA-binding transcriptional regulator [Paenibacillus sp. LHD-117]
MVTIKDIAKRAGVSFSTVSKALLDNPSIKAATKERVWGIAREMGYQPNIAARSLVSKRSGAVGMIWPTVERGALSSLITKLNEELERRGYTTLLSVSRTEAAIESFNRFRMDAVLLFGDQSGSRAELSEIGRMKTPMLVYGPAGYHPFSTVDVNRGHAIRLAVRHLAELGHKLIAYVGEPNGGDLMQTVKIEAFLNEARELGLDVSDDSILRMEGLETHDGYIAAQKMFAWASPPTAVISGGIDLTRGIYRAAHERGLRVPEDLSVVSYDNLPQMEDLNVPTTAVGVSVSSIAVVIAEALHKLIGEPDELQTIYLEPELVARRSTAARNG